ncbi:GPP34 family phosphoprotein [Nocardioides sp. CER19]|uniref:GOLPH3/VPS74 family protein n=1 Tax=Nocardioides sp. CER19 TaxID=3038538 RepID=UPI00244C58EB|nr:GPP34 family phosphoprotein [Nocardioides sp. CER19]MDH2416842.1 GPP34 family phosphoprotein [Nocardioides sp. CER19]
MLIAEDLVLLAYDDEGGRADWRMTERLDAALAGALLIELTEAGRIGLDGEGRKGRLQILDTTPTGEPVLDAALARLEGRDGRRPKDVIGRLTKRLRTDLLEGLAARGVLRLERDRILGLFPRSSWPAEDSSHEDQLRARLQGVLVTGLTPDSRTAAVIALLHAIDAIPRVVDKADRRVARARAKEIAEGDWAAEATRKAVQEVSAAVMTVVIAGAVVAGGSGS